MRGERTEGRTSQPVWEVRGVGRAAGNIEGVFLDKANADYYSQHLTAEYGGRFRVIRGVAPCLGADSPCDSR